MNNLRLKSYNDHVWSNLTTVCAVVYTFTQRSPPQAALIRYVCMYRIILDTLVLEEPTFSHLTALVSDILKHFDTEIGIPYNKGNLYHAYLTEGSIRFKKKDKHQIHMTRVQTQARTCRQTNR